MNVLFLPWTDIAAILLRFRVRDQRRRTRKTVAQRMIRHWLTLFDVAAVICSYRGSQLVGSWFKSMCKHMWIRHVKTVAYQNWSNGRAEVTGRQIAHRGAGEELIALSLEDFTSLQ